MFVSIALFPDWKMKKQNQSGKKNRADKIE